MEADQGAADDAQQRQPKKQMTKISFDEYQKLTVMIVECMKEF